jgi:xanthine dehydrogenase large subunit
MQDALLRNDKEGSRVAGGVADPVPHDSAHKHVTGTAVYTDDIPEPPGTLMVALGMSARAHAEVTSIDLSAVKAYPGVVTVLTASDIPGVNDISPARGAHDDPVFADRLVLHYGQSLFAVAAETMTAARRAARLAKVTYSDRPAILTVDEAMEVKSFLTEPYTFGLGDPDSAIASARHRLRGRVRMGGQEHFYLEGQVALAIPGEDGDVTVHSSTQHPTEIQHSVAHVLGVPFNAVTVEVRRMGGGFGGKESQGNLPAAVAALVVRKTGKPAKARYDRDDDMEITGKRHDFRIDYDVGFDSDGRILGIVFEQAARCGMSFDLSMAICDRAMFHADNAYYLPNARITSYRCKTNTVSNTAFRGFGGPQGMVGIERVMDAIALHLGRDPLAVRRVNYYAPMGRSSGSGRSLTPYHQEVEDCVIAEITDQLVRTSDFEKRRAAIREWNESSPILKRGIALTPVKFGISFTLTQLNQAGALLHVYTDGSLHLNHGGTEMGQGLYQKVAQVVAEEFQCDVANVRITATNTAKVPNTSPTAASSGTDLNGMAAREAARAIKGRLAAVLAGETGANSEEVTFTRGKVLCGGKSFTLAEAAELGHARRVSLSSTGYYATPKIHWDRASGKGRPFYYFAYGAAVTEVAIDTLTGENRMLRVDILHDVGNSLNPAIDLGQIEGGFIQGAGWLTTEELAWDSKGRLATHAPSTYKIPACSDRPPVMNIAIWRGGGNSEETIYRSKAVGEPPLMLGISALLALADAAASVADYRFDPALDAPATPERVLFAVEALKAKARRA